MSTCCSSGNNKHIYGNRSFAKVAIAQNVSGEKRIWLFLRCTFTTQTLWQHWRLYHNRKHTNTSRENVPQGIRKIAAFVVASEAAFGINRHNNNPIMETHKHSRLISLGNIIVNCEWVSLWIVIANCKPSSNANTGASIEWVNSHVTNASAATVECSVGSDNAFSNIGVSAAVSGVFTTDAISAKAARAAAMTEGVSVAEGAPQHRNNLRQTLRQLSKSTIHHRPQHLNRCLFHSSLDLMLHLLLLLLLLYFNRLQYHRQHQLHCMSAESGHENTTSFYCSSTHMIVVVREAAQQGKHIQLQQHTHSLTQTLKSEQRPLTRHPWRNNNTSGIIIITTIIIIAVVVAFVSVSYQKAEIIRVTTFCFISSEIPQPFTSAAIAYVAPLLVVCDCLWAWAWAPPPTTATDVLATYPFAVVAVVAAVVVVVVVSNLSRSV